MRLRIAPGFGRAAKRKVTAVALESAMKKLGIGRSGADRRRLGGCRRRPPTCSTARARPTPSTSRSTPIAGPVPISAAISAMPGDRSTTTRPSRRVSPAACRPATTGRPGPWVFGVEGDIQATGANDTFAPWKFSNPWFGTVRGRVGYAFNNIMFYRHRRSRVRRTARRDVRPVGNPYHRGLDRRRRRRIRPHPELERQDRISLCRSRQQQLHHHRSVERLPVRPDPRRRELSLLTATRTTSCRNLPAATSGRDFFVRMDGTR